AGVIGALVAQPDLGNLVVLASYRPGGEPSWLHEPNGAELRLAPLSRASSRELLDTLLGAAGELDPLREHVLDRTDGNPFFVEECVAELAEAGALVGTRGAYRLGPASGVPKVPATVHAILASRIDRLAPEEKEVLQTAAVIGKDATLTLLRRVSELDSAVLESAIG